MIKAIFFDLDGTLINSLSDLANASNFALKTQALPTHSFDKYRYFVGNGIPNLMKRILPENLQTEENVQKTKAIFLEYYREHFADYTVVYDGIKELIKRLKENGYTLAIITNKAQEMTDLIVKKLFDDDSFDLVIGKRDSMPTKPDPTVVLYALKKLNLNADECIFVGDSNVDIFTAKNSGMTPIGVTWGFRDAKELIESGAAYLIENPLELLNIVMNI